MNKKTVLFLGKVFLISIIMLAFCAAGHIFYAHYSRSTRNASYIDKIDRLKELSVDGNKAVFIGGSATHFGIHTELFEEKTGIRSVNMGLNAGTSFGLYVDSIKPYMKEGDVLFLVPEYGYYEEGWYNSTDNNVEFLLYYAPDTKSMVSTTTLLKYIPSLITTGWKNFGFYFSDTIRMKLSKNEVYKRTSSNVHGDMIIHKTLSPSSFQDTLYDFDEYPFVDDLIKSIREFEAKGVIVYLLFPPLNQTSFEASEECIHGIWQTISKTGVQTLYEPDETAFPNDSFFDTVYHLNYDSGESFTEMIIERFIKNSSLNSR